MGYYFTFWTAPPSGMGEQFTRAALEQWLLAARRIVLEFPQDYSPELLELAEQLLAGPWPAALEPRQHRTFDELVQVVYLSVLNLEINGDWLPPEAVPDGTLAYRWYHDEFKKVQANLSPELRKLLTYPLTGRPIWRNEAKFPYVKKLDHYLMAYWTAEEVRQVWREWPFPVESRPSLYALLDALAQAEAESRGLTLLCI